MSDPSTELPQQAKYFVPLENDAEVMTNLVHKLGLGNSLSFHDVFSIDDPELLAFVPRPATALLLVFPVSESYEKYRAQEDAQRTVYEGSGDGEEVVWYRQTIRNSCGLMGLLHAVSNGGARGFIEPNTDLAALLADAIPLAPTARAKLLYDSPALERAHSAAAQEGHTTAPGATDDIDLHYVCFVKNEKTNHLWELDGSRKGPLDRGLIGENDDVLSEAALDLGPRRFMEREEEVGKGELRFSLVCLAPSLD